MDENKIIWVKAKELQPSQFYINEDSLNILRNNFDINLLEPVPIKKLGEDLVMTDGHTRTCYLVEKGLQYIPTIQEADELDWEAYSINVHDCKERGIISALDLVKCIVPSEIFHLKWNKYCDDVHDRLAYVRNPCDYSALPYWKEVTFYKPANIQVYHENEWGQLSESTKEAFNKVDKFFRIKHPLEQIHMQGLPKSFQFRTFDPNNEKDFDRALEIIRLSYANIDITKDKLKEYTKSEVYENDLWIFIDEINNGKNIPVAFGMADLDSSMNEGILEWIQVLPEYRGKGLGKSLVSKLLMRMKGKAKFATVSGDCNNTSEPINLYRKSGFIGDSIWYIAYKN